MTEKPFYVIIAYKVERERTKKQLKNREKGLFKMSDVTMKNGGANSFKATTVESKKVSANEPQATETVTTGTPQANEKTTANTPQTSKRTRISNRVTENFIFEMDNIVSGENEIFTDIKDLVLFFVKAYNGRELESFRKTIDRKDGLQYETLRIPRATVAAAYAKLQSVMEIEETPVSIRKTQYTIKRVYPAILRQAA